MGKLSAVLTCAAALACAAAVLPATAATDCRFNGLRWQLDGRTGTTYEVVVLRGLTCRQAATLARPLTRKRSTGPQTRIAAPSGWLCLSLSPRGSRVVRGTCARLGKRVSWEPYGGKPVGGRKPPIKPRP